MSRMEIAFDTEAFQRRLRRLYQAWLKPDGNNDFSKMDCMVSARGVNRDLGYSKSCALQTWLFGYELKDTIMVFAETTLCVLTSKKKVGFLRPAVYTKNGNGGITIELLVRDGSAENNNFKTLMRIIRESKQGATLGVFRKENDEGSLMNCWRRALQEENFETVDVSAALGYVIAPKEELELSIIKEASMVCAYVFTKYFKDQFIEIVLAKKKVKHSELCEGVAIAITDKKYVPDVDTTQLHLCYPAIIQSGGNYNLEFSAITDDNLLHFGAILFTLGIRYKSYCSNIVRTLLVGPSQSMKDNCTFLTVLVEEVLKKLQHGVKLCDVYEHGVNCVKKEKPALANKLTKNFGFAMGIEFREDALTIEAKTVAKAKKGMVFNVNIGLSNLVNDEPSDKEGKIYALFFGDTVVVNYGSPATVLTTSIFLNDEPTAADSGSEENEEVSESFEGDIEDNDSDDNGSLGREEESEYPEGDTEDDDSDDDESLGREEVSEYSEGDTEDDEDFENGGWTFLDPESDEEAAPDADDSEEDDDSDEDEHSCITIILSSEEESGIDWSNLARENRERNKYREFVRKIRNCEIPSSSKNSGSSSKHNSSRDMPNGSRDSLSKDRHRSDRKRSRDNSDDKHRSPKKSRK